MGKAFAITFGALAAIAIFVVYRTGYLEPVDIGSGSQGPFVLIYKQHTGPYHKIAPVIDEVERTFKEANIDCPMAFGRFLHDPNVVPHDRLESHGGCALPTTTNAVEKFAKSNNYQIDRIDKKEYLVATFNGSPSVGPLRVYPEVEAWMNKYGYKNKGPVIELYQTTGPDSLTTRYLFTYD